MPNQLSPGDREKHAAADTIAPSQSDAFQQVLRQAEHDGVDPDALRRLLWLLNAHPRLIGHQRCLQNLGSLLGTPEFVDGLDVWAGPWTAHVPRWVEITEWAGALSDANATGLKDFIRPPRNDKHNLLMRHGINRHPGVGALWVRHHGDPDPAQRTTTLPPASRVYRLLQWHLFCSQAEARHERSSIEQYMAYGGPHEWPAWPRPAAAVGLALRELSYGQWDDVLIELPFEPELSAFAKALVNDKEQLLKFAEDSKPKTTGSAKSEATASARLLALAAYFEDFDTLLSGRAPKVRRKGGGGRGGNRVGIPGFVHFNSSPQVCFEPPEEASDDEDVPHRDFTRVHIHSEAMTSQAIAELESHDIAPDEDLRPVMDLFPASERAGGMSSLWLRRLALESAAQGHFWDKSQMTPVETSAVLDALDETSNTAACTSEQCARSEARLLVRSMLVLGCRMEEVRTMRLMTSSRMAEATSLAGAPVTRVALVDDAGVVCIALAHPAVSPRYVSTPQAVYLQRANAAAKHITLPDVAELGTALLKHVTGRAVDLDGPVFQTPVAELEAHVKDLLAQINRSLDSASRPRVTLAKVAGKLPSLLARAGLDEVGVALVCGDTRYAGQARLHYTQHRTGHLVQFYTKAVRRLFREAGRPIRALAQNYAPAVAYVGARLVVKHEHLHDFITNLKAEIRTRPASTRSGRHRYHSSFLLYTTVMQALTTGIRPTSRPDRIMTATPTSAMQPATNALLQSIVEKDDQYESKSRVVAVLPRLQKQLLHLVAHARGTWRWRPSDLMLPTATGTALMFIDWSDTAAPPLAQVIDPAWVADQLSKHGLPAPSNFHRGYLRTRLLASGCPEPVIDAFLGHAGIGQSPYHFHGTLDHAAYLATIASQLEGIVDELGLVPIASWLAEPDVDTRDAS